MFDFPSFLPFIVAAVVENVLIIVVAATVASIALVFCNLPATNSPAGRSGTEFPAKATTSGAQKLQQVAKI